MPLKLVTPAAGPAGLAAIMKICGLSRRADAEWSVRQGATHLGFVFHPASPRAVTPGQARTLHAGLPVLKVGVFVDLEPARVAEIMTAARLDIAQLHGHESAGDFRGFEFPVWRTLRSPDQAAQEADQWDDAALFVLDLGAGESLGGTGRAGSDGFAALFTADYAALLSGGLTPGNVADRVSHVLPRGVDVSSGVESSRGVKDEKLIGEFLANAGAALRETGLIVKDPGETLP